MEEDGLYAGDVDTWHAAAYAVSGTCRLSPLQRHIVEPEAGLAGWHKRQFCVQYSRSTCTPVQTPVQTDGHTWLLVNGCATKCLVCLQSITVVQSSHESSEMMDSSHTRQ
jgi:hypothetical protein